MHTWLSVLAIRLQTLHNESFKNKNEAVLIHQKAVRLYGLCHR